MHLLFRVATSRSCRCVRPSVPVLDFKLAVHEAGRSRGAVKFKELLCRWLQSPNPPLDDKTSVRTMQLTIGLLLRCAPALLKAAVLHLLSLSQTSRVWDLRTTLFLTLVKAARFGSPGRLIDAQQSSIRADGNGISSSSLHVVEDHFPLPKDNNVKEVVYQAIEDLSSGGETFADVEVNPVGGEWVGHRNIATSKAEEASSASQSVVSRCPNDEYSALVRDTQNGITILYFHGGQFWRADPSTHRSVTHQLARDTCGRCFSLRWRLSPQNPFPTALIDGLVAYLSLLYPPPGSLHSAVPPEDIAFAGDSSGGNHALALLQLILQMRRATEKRKTKLVWLGREIEDLPLPACVTALSGYLDLTRALDSEEGNLKYDIIPPRGGPPFSDFVPCEVWPIRRGDTHPPRHHVYANDDALLHPLVSPVTATNWKGSPPTWFGNGEECLVEACMFVVQRMVQQQCRQEGEEDDQRGTAAVVFEEFAGMPHNFPLLLEKLEASRTCMKHWAEFIRLSVLSPQSSALKTKAVKWSGRDAPLRADSLSIRALTRVNLEEVKERMRFQIKQWGPPPSVA